MSLLSVENFRLESLVDACQGLPLTEDEAPDSRLAAAITRLQRRLESPAWCNDQFATASETIDITVVGTSSWLYLPKRCTAVTTVKTRDASGTLVTLDASAYRLHSSLDSTGAIALGEVDALEVAPSGAGVWGQWYWPLGHAAVQVAGSFGWVTPNPDIARALALLVYDHFKPIRNDLRRAESYDTADARIAMSTTTPSGIPEVDDIIAANTRRLTVQVG